MSEDENKTVEEIGDEAQRDVEDAFEEMRAALDKASSDNQSDD